MSDYLGYTLNVAIQLYNIPAPSVMSRTTKRHDLRQGLHNRVIDLTSQAQYDPNSVSQLHNQIPLKLHPVSLNRVRMALR